MNAILSQQLDVFSCLSHLIIVICIINPKKNIQVKHVISG